MNFFRYPYFNGIHAGIFCVMVSVVISIVPTRLRAQSVTESRSIAEAEAKAARKRVGIDDTSLRTQASPEFRIQYLRCKWTVDPAVQYINGEVKAAIQMIAAADVLIFDLIDQLRVDSVLFHDAKINFSRPGNNTLRIQLPAQLAANSKDAVEIFYQGVPAAGGFGSFVSTTHAGTPVCWTLSEPYGSRDWWPCRNGLDDKADSLDVFITTPEQYTGVSIGMLKQSIIENGQKTTHWKHRYPVATYLIALAATNYTEMNDTVHVNQKVLPMVHYVYPESAPVFRNGLRFVRRTLRIFNDTFGPYPFLNEKYGHTQFSWGGGMENQTNSFMTNSSEALIVHEAAHQWFGDLITCGSWRDIWLNEGFAHFLTNYTTEKFYSKTLYQTILKEQLTDLVKRLDGSVYVTDTTDIARIFDPRLTYAKGGWLLHMLRWKIGDSAFFKGMRTYYSDPKLAYNFAYSTDFIDHMQKASGQDLSEFFNDWLYGEGYPRYQLTWNNAGNGWIYTSLSQTPSSGAVFFDMPVPIRFKNATRDTIIVIDHIKNSQQSFLQLGFAADSAFIDPELRLISDGNSVMKIPDDNDETASVAAFPNPVIADLNLTIKHFEPGTYRFGLYSSTGQQVWLNKEVNISRFYSLQIPMAQLPQGVYFLRINSSNGYKLIKKIIR
ncbi:M1 family aminopeptidase [Pollutibacter soli]|uniref:M1 family aminopeptidase n=1 Tax=Pollutibacter soli TaxID=3034157 RepID=UPI0030133EDF